MILVEIAGIEPKLWFRLCRRRLTERIDNAMKECSKLKTLPTLQSLGTVLNVYDVDIL